jgi:lysozyme
MNSLTYSGKGIALTKSFEGRKYKAYRDQVSVWTCGDGHTFGVGPSTVCDDALADQWLEEDTRDAAAAVNRLVTTPLSQGEFDALVDFVFNLGAHAFAESTMLEFLNAGNHIRAAGQFERWDHAGGVVVAGLLRRRVAEKLEFTGEA